MTAGKPFDPELFKRAARAGATAAGIKDISEVKLQRVVDEVAALDVKTRRKVLAEHYLKDQAFRDVWVAGGGDVTEPKPKPPKKRRKRGWPA